MKINDYIRWKAPWTRRVTGDTPTARQLTQSGAALLELTQDNFLDELSPGSHRSNSQYRSHRPIWGPTGKKDKNGKDIMNIIGYDDVETVCLGLQEAITQRKISHFAADGFWYSNETTDDKRFQTLGSYVDRIGLMDAYFELVRSCFRTGDGALYLYRDMDGIDYEVFSYEKGDTLYPGFTDNGEKYLARKYRFQGKEAVDIFTDTYRETWIHADEEDSDEQKSFIAKILAYIKGSRAIREKSEDGWTLVSRVASQAGKGHIQVVYFRVPDIPSGVAELAIESYEAACGYNADSVKTSAYPILFVKSEKVTSLPPAKLADKILAVRGSSDTLQHADAKFLDPPDHSNTADLHLSTLWEHGICQPTMSVFVDPEIMKSGADSSTAMKILFQPEMQWCQNMWPFFAKGVREVMNIFKELVGQEESDVTGYSELKVSIGQNIWIPQNTTETVDNETKLVYAKIKSCDSARDDLNLRHINEAEKVREEWEYEVRMKAEIPAEINAKYGTSVTVSEESNPELSEQGIDNNAAGKSVTE